VEAVGHAVVDDAARSLSSTELLESLYRERQTSLLRVAVAVCGSREMAREVVHEAFARGLTRRFDDADHAAREAVARSFEELT
jgi:DNA-directed RNA polymerase specialized sigma24 family protein